MFGLVYVQSGQTAAKTVKVTAPKVPYEVSFGSFNKSIAWGDEDFYVPIIVKDKFGNILTNEDIAKNADKISVYAYGTAGSVSIINNTGASTVMTQGAYQGMIHVNGLKANESAKNGNLTLNAMVTNTGKSATYSTTVLEKRYPNQVYVSSEPKAKMLPSLNDFGQSSGLVNLNAAGLTENKMKIKFKDQYGDPLLLLTNGAPDLQQEKIDSIPGIADYFDHIIISGTFGAGKPAPSIFQHAMELLGISPEEGMMVGDNLDTDIKGAGGIGMRSVWINHEGRTAPAGNLPTYEIGRLSELLDILQPALLQQKRFG